MAEAAWNPDDDFLRSSNIARFMARHGFASHHELQEAWVSDPVWFWATVADTFELTWYERPARTLDASDGAPWARWFPGGVTNLVEWCVERHPDDALALVAETESGDVRRLTYADLSALVAEVAGGLRALGVARGDRVGILLPLGPEAIASLYACAKIGAIAVPFFSGYGADAVADRLRDAGADLLIAADGFRRRGRAIDLAATAELAARAAGTGRVVVWPLLAAPGASPFMDAAPVVRCERLPAEHPFLIAYTSGTTGRPKGAVHVHGGFPLKAAAEIALNCDQRDGELLFWPTDPGWIMAPLTALGAAVRGQALLLYDGAPDHPAPSRIAEMIARHGVVIFGTSPSFVRSVMKRADHGFDRGLPSLRVLASSGEPWNETAWRWYFERVGGTRCPVVNLAGGTEAGSLLGVTPVLPIAPCGFNSPCPGIDADVFASDGTPAAPGEIGELVVRQPWPGRTHGFWNDRSRYLQAYWSRWTDVWVHGDWASCDVEGSWFLRGRSDDTMMIAGKRVGPAEVESVLTDHPAVVDAAAVSIPEEIKGESIVCLVVARDGSSSLEDQLRMAVADKLGKAFVPAAVYVVPALPRTRNGKIVRRLIRDALVGCEGGDLSSIENPEVVHDIRRLSGVTAGI